MMKPMITAPKDGSEIIIFTDEVITAFWQDGWYRVICTDPYLYYPCDPRCYGKDPNTFCGWTEIK
jgi:hypothetical protein